MDEERILAMSAFEAAYLIRTFREKHPELSTLDIVATVRSVRADFYPHDYDAGAHIEQRIPLEIVAPLESFFTAAIEAIIADRSPIWARLAPAGRNHVLQAMGVNGVQCFRSAGLLGSDARATNWWDALASANRGHRDARLLAQGREGERLSLAYENTRLQRERISRAPVWVAIEDNTVGYDILSYAWHDGNEVSRLIEVKTTHAYPPRMILSRNEWKTAEQYGTSFEFHLWNLNNQALAIYTVNEIRKHIPTNNGSGKWENVEIRLA
ncbi:DUF3883 domain-containing protein [Robbsia andropogonis]|uniref:DUF3883 domain-containing protein n=1 Tax=Robbsia andropogonis TaxID=28092 RepID=UPI00209EB748|nr:DUF3883 domain-containing protein [Robbsia andropogonis]MCP1131066.1 DUF3883 domain-containing protein [Robbsia andropogonis]